MRNIALLGSTGSIGRQTLDVVRHEPDMKVTALTAHKNIKLLEEQIREFRPGIACVTEEADAADLAARVADLPVRIVHGVDGMTEAAVDPACDTVLTAVVGMIGIRPTIAAIKAGKDIALANKETMVCAGHIIIPLAREHGVSILPVDSEHSAIFQCLHGNRQNPVRRILLTASGGPFRGMKYEQTALVTAADALKHPNWTMGDKITIDSADMVNKALEVMEAHWLFDVSYDQIEVLVHPQSIVHSMVEYEDGAVMAQMGAPDMRLPIQYALTYPDRHPMETKKLDFFAIRELTFEKPDPKAFPGLPLGISAGRRGGSMPAVFNAANEWANARFRKGEITFHGITDMIAEAMERHTVIEDPTVDEIEAAQKEVDDYLGTL